MGEGFHGRTSGGSPKGRIVLPNTVHHAGYTCDQTASEDTKAATKPFRASLAFITAATCIGLDSIVLIELMAVEHAHDPRL